ncbi:MAG: tetratricopeptide repeat protein [Vicinamibacterales bacterium]|nr:tetratricopeptide repeat protein [Vicinamibacterales bacterium]
MHARGLAIALLVIVLGAAAVYWPSPPSSGHAGHVSAAGAAPLGTIRFPASGAPEAHAHFLRGVLWLHNFGYEDAIDAFREAQRVDPGFVMAYWGEALAHSQPLWFHEDRDAARAVLARLGASREARTARAQTARERAYLDAVETLFGDGSLAVRGPAYAEAMARLVAAYPDDDEAQVFHALAILAVMPSGDASLPYRERAGALAEGVFARNQEHPGAAHLILHAYDHGALAHKGLGAARVYARIAPAASHALHMPAHAFVQLGLWEEAAATDLKSWEASVAWADARGHSVALRDFHSLTWLHYEWTQLGRFTDALTALRWVDDARAVIKPTDEVGGHHYADSAIGRGSGPEALRNDRGSMRARYVIESERWFEMRDQSTFDNVDELFALGMSAVKLGDLPRVSAAIGQLQEAARQDPGNREQTAIMLLELIAMLEFAQGRPTEAFTALRNAVTLQDGMPKPIGRPYPVKGADELFGELSLQAGRPAEAVAWFERTLTRTPNRSRAVLGLARAAAQAGDVEKSRQAYEQFLANWRNADPDLPELQEARTAVGR